MNKKEICFIICTNNEILLSECITYINRLFIPEGYDIDLLTVSDAKSMTSGYNEAMSCSDAKYKVYMHQDVFIINRFFLYDLLSVFETDSGIGMIGMVGYKSVSPVGIMWNEKRYGEVPMYGQGGYVDKDAKDYRFYTEDGIEDVEIIDGLMMITSVDLEWDEDFDAWDFYDASQSVRFRNEGYRIVVPTQLFPWIIHDDGTFLSMWNYNQYRKLFLNKYAADKKLKDTETAELEVNRHYSHIAETKELNYNLLDKMQAELCSLVVERDYCAFEIINDLINDKDFIYTGESYKIGIILLILKREVESFGDIRFGNRCKNYSDINELFTYTMHMIRRIELFEEDECLFDFFVTNGISSVAVITVLKYGCYEKKYWIARELFIRLSATLTEEEKTIWLKNMAELMHD